MKPLSEERWLDLERVVSRLKESLALPDDPVARDSAILRFELAFEVAWKVTQALARNHGLEVNSPRQAFGAALRLGWVTDEVLWCEVIEARNLAIHVYREELAIRLHSELPRYLAGFEELMSSLQKSLEE